MRTRRRSPKGLQQILDAAGFRAAASGSSPGRRATHGPTHVDATSGLRQFDDFIANRVDRIEGWMHAEAALLTAHLAGVQRALGLAGPTLEIGLFHGKYLAVLYKLSNPDEVVVGVDLFVGSNDTKADVARVEANIAAACGDHARLKVIVADSMDLTPERLRQETGGLVHP